MVGRHSQTQKTTAPSNLSRGRTIFIRLHDSRYTRYIHPSASILQAPIYRRISTHISQLPARQSTSRWHVQTQPNVHVYTTSLQIPRRKDRSLLCCTALPASIDNVLQTCTMHPIHVRLDYHTAAIAMWGLICALLAP